MLRAGTCQPSPVAALRASHTGRLRSHPDAVRAQRCPEPGGNFWPVISADLIRDDQSAPHVGHDGGRVLLAVGCRRHEREREREHSAGSAGGACSKYNPRQVFLKLFLPS
jgi:hypothetical protein